MGIFENKYGFTVVATEDDGTVSKFWYSVECHDEARHFRKSLVDNGVESIIRRATPEEAKGGVFA